MKSSNKSPGLASRIVYVFCYAILIFAGLCLSATSVLIAWLGIAALGPVAENEGTIVAVGGAIIAAIAGSFTIPVGAVIMALIGTREEEGEANPLLAILGAILIPLLTVLFNWFMLIPVWLISPIVCGLLCYNMPSESAALWVALVAPGAGAISGLLAMSEVFGSSESN